MEEKENVKTEDNLIEEGETGADYLEQLLDILDFDGDIDIEVENNRPLVSITGGGKNASILTGNKGEVLEALQELTRLAVLRSTGEPSYLMLDIDGFRKKKRKQITELAHKHAKECVETKEKIVLEPMSAFERKIIHDVVSEYENLSSNSEGEGKGRHIIITHE